MILGQHCLISNKTSIGTFNLSNPFIIFKFSHPPNILSNDLIFDVSHPVRSRDSTWDRPKKNRHFNTSTFGGITICLKSTFFPWVFISSFIISLKSINVFLFLFHRTDLSLLCLQVFPYLFFL